MKRGLIFFCVHGHFRKHVRLKTEIFLIDEAWLIIKFFNKKSHFLFLISYLQSPYPYLCPNQKKI